MTKNEAKQVNDALDDIRMVLKRMTETHASRPRIIDESNFSDAAAWAASCWKTLLALSSHDEHTKSLIRQDDDWMFNDLDVLESVR